MALSPRAVLPCFDFAAYEPLVNTNCSESHSWLCSYTWFFLRYNCEYRHTRETGRSNLMQYYINHNRQHPIITTFHLLLLNLLHFRLLLNRCGQFYRLCCVRWSRCTIGDGCMCAMHWRLVLMIINTGDTKCELEMNSNAHVLSQEAHSSSIPSWCSADLCPALPR